MEDGQRLVGRVDRRQAILNSGAAIYSARRFIGRKRDEVDEESRIASCKVVRGANDALRFEVLGKMLAPGGRPRACQGGEDIIDAEFTEH